MAGAEEPRRRPTIRQVAQHAGVSHQTVSRYLRSREGLKAKTLAQIDAAVEELGWRPNVVARSLATRRTGRLAILLPTVAFDPARVVHGATRAADEAGYTVEVLSIFGGIEARTERTLELVDSGQVEGVLALAPIDPSIGTGRPGDPAVVVAADFDDEMRGIGELADATPIVEMVERLAELGHRRCFHVAGNLEFASARARKAAYLDTVGRLGLESVGVFDGDWSSDSGIEAVRSLPADRMPTAIIAANDVVAGGVMHAVIERGLRVPEDVSVTGWDNDALSPFLAAPLTTVEIDLEGLGRNAMVRLVKAVSGQELAPSPGPIHSVVWRGSLAPPP